jgi:tetratricopeptide (TPR) repeat protein
MINQSSINLVVTVISSLVISSQNAEAFTESRPPSNAILLSQNTMTKPSDADLKKADLLYRSGLEKAQQRLYPEAVQDFSEAIKIHPLFTAAYVSRAQMQPITDEGRKLAIQDFKTVIEIHKSQGTLESIPLMEQEIKTLESEMGQK